MSFSLFHISDSTLLIKDSLSNSFSNSSYFDEGAVKSYFNYLLRCMTYSKDTEFSVKRSLRSVSYKKTKFTQRYLECGPLSALNLIMSLSHTSEFLCSYTLREYDMSLTNFKHVIQAIFDDGIIPANKIVFK